MNFQLVCWLLGIVSWLIGGTMALSLPWAHPALGAGQQEFETHGFWSLVASMGVCLVVGFVLRHVGRDGKETTLYRREAMAVVGLSWVLATVLGGLPYYFANVVYLEDGGIAHPMGIADSLFESQSGFSTTGATVLTRIENQHWVPRCILFWRSSTHFLGGLGIIVLFVAILGHGSAGKALMRAEMPGPSKEGSQERMQHTAWVFAAIYIALNVLLAVILRLESRWAIHHDGVSWFEAICHAFGTMATGGFSTMDTSLGGFESKAIEYTVIVFMILAGTNFTLLYLTLIHGPGRLLRDVEWQTYTGIIIAATAAIVIAGVWGRSDFDPQESLTGWQHVETAFRDVLFQVVSIMTTTGFGTADFDLWSNFSRALLLFLMFVGGCAGSTGGGMKVIRHILFVKIVGREFEHAYHPSVVRHLRLGNDTITDSELPRQILVYVGLVAMIFVTSWVLLVAIEPDSTWTEAGQPEQNKLIDSAGAVAATLHNIGPGLGIVGPTRNYAYFSAPAKLLFTFLMMLGRIELFAILVLVLPSFWRER
jgi:trk system potassium uptake protein TrkH